MAINKLKTSVIDLILMDIQMPLLWMVWRATKAIRMGDKTTRRTYHHCTIGQRQRPRWLKMYQSGMNDHLIASHSIRMNFMRFLKMPETWQEEVATWRPSLLGRTYKVVDLSLHAKVSKWSGVYQRCVSSFLSTPPLLDGIQESLQAGDTKKWHNSSIAIKPSLTMIGLGKTKELADYLGSWIGHARNFRIICGKASARIYWTSKTAVDELECALTLNFQNKVLNSFQHHGRCAPNRWPSTSKYGASMLNFRLPKSLFFFDGIGLHQFMTLFQKILSFASGWFECWSQQIQPTTGVTKIGRDHKNSESFPITFTAWRDIPILLRLRAKRC